MATYSDYFTKQKAFNDRQANAVDSAVASVEGLRTDVKNLNDRIEALQTSAGQVTPEDQTLIDQLEATGDAISTKLDSVAAGLKALDEQTPPVAPPAPTA